MTDTEGTLTIRELGRAGDLGWAVMANGELYVNEFGWDTTFETMCVRIVADYAAASDEPGHAAWIAELNGERVGCVFVVPGDEHGVAKLRLLLVDEEDRCRGVG